MPLFNLKDLIPETIKSEAENPDAQSAVCIQNYENIHFAKIKKIEDLIAATPRKNEIYFIWTQNAFNSVTFILYIIKNIGQIKEVIITTYAINERIINSFAKWQDNGMLENITMFISDTIKSRSPRIHNQLETYAQQRNWKIIYAWNHSKVMLLKTKSEHFVVEGSGNLSDNSRYENYIFTNNKKIYDFRRKHIIAHNL